MITVVDYDPDWPRLFESLRSKLHDILGDTVSAVEHVGSTSVPGLSAKPVIDIDIVVADDARLAAAIQKLSASGYPHRGDLGIDGREAFDTSGKTPPHNLYACVHGSLGLRNHLAVRDLLRSHSALVSEYSELKIELARKFPDDIDRYIDGKTEFILSLLQRCNFSGTELDSIRQANTES